MRTQNKEASRLRRGRPSRDWFLDLHLILREFSGPITEQGKANRITFDTQLKMTSTGFLFMVNLSVNIFIYSLQEWCYVTS